MNGPCTPTVPFPTAGQRENPLRKAVLIQPPDDLGWNAGQILDRICFLWELRHIGCRGRKKGESCTWKKEKDRYHLMAIILFFKPKTRYTRGLRPRLASIDAQHIRARGRGKVRAKLDQNVPSEPYYKLVAIASSSRPRASTYSHTRPGRTGGRPSVPRPLRARRMGRRGKSPTVFLRFSTGH